MIEEKDCNLSLLNNALINWKDLKIISCLKIQLEIKKRKTEKYLDKHIQ